MTHETARERETSQIQRTHADEKLVRENKAASFPVETDFLDLMNKTAALVRARGGVEQARLALNDCATFCDSVGGHDVARKALDFYATVTTKIPA